MGENDVGPEHSLCALLEVKGGTGALAGLGLNKAATEEHIAAAAAAPPADGAAD